MTAFTYTVYDSDRKRLASGPTKESAFSIALILYQRAERVANRTPLSEAEFRKQVTITRKPKDHAAE